MDLTQICRFRDPCTFKKRNKIKTYLFKVQKASSTTQGQQMDRTRVACTFKKQNKIKKKYFFGSTSIRYQPRSTNRSDNFLFRDKNYPQTKVKNGSDPDIAHKSTLSAVLQHFTRIKWKNTYFLVWSHD